MDNYQELLAQIHESLMNSDLATLSILLEDEPQSLIVEIRSRLDPPALQKFNSYLQLIQTQHKNKQEQSHNQEAIRKINTKMAKKLESSDQQDILEKEVKLRRPAKLQQKFGYDFYGQIKCLMIAYGDLQVGEDAVKMMHSQLQILWEIFFKFVEHQSKGSKINEQMIRKYLGAVFKEECKYYQQVSKSYKKATNKTKANQQQLLGEVSEDMDSDSDSQQELEKEQAHLHMQNNTLQESEYFAQLTKNMDEAQYQHYCQSRAVNFIQGGRTVKKNVDGIQKFIKFLQAYTKLLKPQMKVFDLLSFICCRLVRRVIFTSIRNGNDGKLRQLKDSESISSEQIRRMGNELIQAYQKQLKSARNKQEQLLQQARALFLEDLTQHNFVPLLARNYASKEPGQIWQQAKMYREMWVFRLQGEKEYESDCRLFESGEVEPANEYARFILKHEEFYRARGRTLLWRRYFGQERVEDGAQGGARKKVKLESLRN